MHNFSELAFKGRESNNSFLKVFFLWCIIGTEEFKGVSGHVNIRSSHVQENTMHAISALSKITFIV